VGAQIPSRPPTDYVERFLFMLTFDCIQAHVRKLVQNLSPSSIAVSVESNPIPSGKVWENVAKGAGAGAVAGVGFLGIGAIAGAIGGAVIGAIGGSAAGYNEAMEKDVRGTRANIKSTAESVIQSVTGNKLNHLQVEIISVMVFRVPTYKIHELENEQAYLEQLLNRLAYFQSMLK
jgi:hypothetical protein